MAWRCAEQKKMDFWAKVTQSLYWPYMYHLWFYIPQTNSLALLKSRSRNCTCILQMGFILCKRYASFLLSAFSIFFLLFLLIKGFLFTANICYSVIMLQKIINVLSKENTWMHTWYLSFLVPSSRDMYKCTNAWQVSWEMSCSGHQHQFLQKGKRFGRAWQFAGEVSILT